MAVQWSNRLSQIEFLLFVCLCDDQITVPAKQDAGKGSKTCFQHNQDQGLKHAPFYVIKTCKTKPSESKRNNPLEKPLHRWKLILYRYGIF